MPIDERAMRIADASNAGGGPSRDDVMHLLSFDAYSVEAAETWRFPPMRG